MAEKLKVTYRRIEDLIPYARNARTHSDDQVARIAGSIKEFGWTNPILVDGENGIIAGHGRLAAARKLGMSEVPVIELAGLSDVQKRAYILADNRLALDAGWDDGECLIWVKNSLVLGRQDYQWRHEPCLYGWKEGAAHKWYSDRSQSTVLEFDKPTRNGVHPTMKPVELFRYLMENSSKKGDVVFDSFGGSGTTLIASEETGRFARLMERIRGTWM